MKILALEFSSPQCSVAVVRATAGGAANCVSEIIETGRGSARALALVEDALRQAAMEREEIECLAVGLGPGSYTGIRVAIALTQGWQLASRGGGLKILGIGSAEAIARQAQAENLRGRISVVIDAQRNELYLACYELDDVGCRETAPLRLAGLAEAQERERAGEMWVGPEIARWFPNGRIVFPRASVLGRMAQTRNDFVSGEKLEPIYLRETAFVKAPPGRVVP